MDNCKDYRITRTTFSNLIDRILSMVGRREGGLKDGNFVWCWRFFLADYFVMLLNETRLITMKSKPDNIEFVLFLSNSTLTCKPNSTSVSLSRSWLCFPTEEEEQEEGRNPHLASTTRNDPTCLNFADCLVGVLRVLGNCLEGVWQVSDRCLKGVLRVS